MNQLGIQVIGELGKCCPKLLDDVEFIRKTMQDAAEACGATVIETMIHQFNPHGISGVVVISESHITIHTWPEYGYAAVDVFTCGTQADPFLAINYLKESLQARESKIREIPRGHLNDNIEIYEDFRQNPSLHPV